LRKPKFSFVTAILNDAWLYVSSNGFILLMAMLGSVENIYIVVYKNSKQISSTVKQDRGKKKRGMIDG